MNSIVLVISLFLLVNFSYTAWQQLMLITDLVLIKKQQEHYFCLTKSLMLYGQMWLKRNGNQLLQQPFMSLTFKTWPPHTAHAGLSNLSAEIIFKREHELITITAALYQNRKPVKTSTSLARISVVAESP